MLLKLRPLLTLLLLVGFGGPACGKKGDPQPPLRRSPQPATDFDLAQRGGQLVVRLTTPHAYSDGSRLPLLDVELLRAEQPGDFAKQAKSRRRRAAPGERLLESEPVPSPGTQIRYAVRVLAKGKASALSGVVSLTVQEPPPSPSALSVARSAGGLTLDWSAPPVPPMQPPVPTRTPAASPAPSPAPPAPDRGPTPSPAASPLPAPSPPPSPAAPLPPESPAVVPSTPPGPPASPAAATAAPPPTSGFWVYRRSATGPYAEPLSPAPVAAPPFLDGETATETVCYVVRTVMATAPLVESVDSNEVCVPPEMPAPPGTE